MPTYSISGNAGIGRATIFYSGTSSGSVSADIFGAYTITGLSSPGTYTITPSLPTYRFFPNSQTEIISGSNLTNVNFSASNTLNIFLIKPLYGQIFCDPGLSNSPDGVTDQPCRLISISADNSLNASPSFVKAYSVGTPIVGVTPPQLVLRVPTGAIVTEEFHTGNYPGTVFLTALSIACTTTGGSTGNTGPSFPVVVSIKFSGD